MNNDKHPQIFIVSGFDPSGGAGLIADIETVHALGCRTSAVITCQTIQTKHNATMCLASNETWFKDQLDLAIQTHSFSAIKIGLTPSVKIINIVAAALMRVSCPIVIDPIIAASGGYVFCDANTVDHLSRKLIPLCDLATPNRAELHSLTNASDQGAISLLKKGCKAILVSSEYEKEGLLHHRLYRLHQPAQTFTAKHLPHHYHGSGCTLSSAIAAYLAHGEELESAIQHAQEFTDHCLRTATATPHRVTIPLRFKQ